MFWLTWLLLPTHWELFFSRIKKLKNNFVIDKKNNKNKIVNQILPEFYPG